MPRFIATQIFNGKINVRNLKTILSMLAVSMIAILTLGGCQKAPEVVGEKLIDYSIDGIGNIKAKIDARNYFNVIDKQLPNDANQPATRWVRRCAIKDYLIFHNYYAEQPLESLASANIETCQKELKVLKQALSTVVQ